MYSPKIAEELIPHLYRIAKAQQIPMTRLVNGVFKQYIKEHEDEVRNSQKDRNSDYRVAG